MIAERAADLIRFGAQHDETRLQLEEQQFELFSRLDAQEEERRDAFEQQALDLAEYESVARSFWPALGNASWPR